MCRTLYDAKIADIGYTTSTGAKETLVPSRGMRQTDVLMGRGKMGRYIEVNDVANAIYHHFPSIRTMTDARGIIEEAPSIDIVRCKECKHRYDDGWLEPRWTCDYLKDMRLKEDDFCSYGEREGE